MPVISTSGEAETGLHRVHIKFRVSLDNLVRLWFRKKAGIEMNRGRKGGQDGEKKEGGEKKRGREGEKGKPAYLCYPLIYRRSQAVRWGNGNIIGNIYNIYMRVYPESHIDTFPRGKYPCLLCSMDLGCPLKPCVEGVVAI